MAKKKGMKLIANNKKAFHDYFIEDTYEAGIALAGTEVKSLRMGKCSIKESFIRVENGEVYIYGMHISPYEKGNIFNLGNGVGYSVKEVIDKARKVTGHPIPAIETPKRAGDPARLVASSEKARKILGWNPVHDSLEEIISDAWNWHKNHPDGF